MGLRNRVKEQEAREIYAALANNGGSIRKAARDLNLPVSTLASALKTRHIKLAQIAMRLRTERPNADRDARAIGGAQ